MGLIPKEWLKTGFFSICASGLSICSGWIIAFAAPRPLTRLTHRGQKPTEKSVGNPPFVSRKEWNLWHLFASQKCRMFVVLKLQFYSLAFVSLVDIVGFMKAATGFTNKFGPPTHCLRSGLRGQSNWRRMVALHLRFVPWWCTWESCFECPFGDITYMDIIINRSICVFKSIFPSCILYRFIYLWVCCMCGCLIEQRRRRCCPPFWPTK